MEFDELERFIDKHIKMIKPKNITSKQAADERAADFLYAQAIISVERNILKENKVSVKSMNSMVFAECLKKFDGKKVTKDKALAEADGNVIEARETLEILDSNIRHLKTMEKVFENAHVFYRNFFRD